MSCARCGCGIYKTDELISLNKTWHKCCFTCYQCKKRLDKDSAKIFQGELFCEFCYSYVIEKLFEVISRPSLNKPCKVASTPSCSVNPDFLQELLGCSCTPKSYCFPAEKPTEKCCPKPIQSCSCLPTDCPSKNEYCFFYPIPREVANYYSRSHMKSKRCKSPVSCCPQRDCPACCCRKTCCAQPAKCPPRDTCCCCCPPPRCRPPKKCCCPKPPPPCTPVFVADCSCCSPKSSSPCCPPKMCPSPVVEPCKCCCQASACKPKCPPPKCCPPIRCCPSPKCPPMTCCPSPKCPPRKCYPVKVETCYEQCSVEKSCCSCAKPRKHCCCPPKYCVCGNSNPCNCKMSQIRALCTVCCNRCGQKVYAAEKVVVSSGAYHTSCFTCFCCRKCLDVKTVFEGCGEIYCKQCYNNYFGVQYYGFGGPNC